MPTSSPRAIAIRGGYARGRRLCVLALQGGELCAWRTDGTAMPLRDRGEAERAADAIMADFAAALRSGAEDVEVADVAAGAVEPGNGAVGDALAWLRRGATPPELSREELRALQGGDGSP